MLLQKRNNGFAPAFSGFDVTGMPAPNGGQFYLAEVKRLSPGSISVITVDPLL